MGEAPSLFHVGKKIKRLRELKGMKQETLATKLGVSHQAISKIEQSENIDEDKLAQIAQALGVSSDTIKNFDEDTAINFFNTITNNKFDNHSTAMIYQQYINPIEKIVELYERLLQSEREKIELLKSKTGPSE